VAPRHRERRRGQDRRLALQKMLAEAEAACDIILKQLTRED
jgi:hypothetical protein